MGSCSNCYSKKIKITTSTPPHHQKKANPVKIYNKSIIFDKKYLNLTKSTTKSFSIMEKLNASNGLIILNKKKSQNKKNPFDKIENNSFIKILDYLQFKELQEVGKVNRKMNRAVKNWKILVKFFRKRLKS